MIFMTDNILYFMVNGYAFQIAINVKDYDW